MAETLREFNERTTREARGNRGALQPDAAKSRSQLQFQFRHKPDELAALAKVRDFELPHLISAGLEPSYWIAACTLAGDAR